ncbi:radical SAM protein [bacterium]|nr:radical SAM protein [bacterium]
MRGEARIRDFLFRSDLSPPTAWGQKLCAALAEAKLDIRWSCNSRVDKIKEDLLITMKQAGCWLIAFGVESGSPDLLEKMKKAADLDDARRAMAVCRSVGIKSSIYILIGLPWETEETFRAGVDFAIELDPDYIEFFYVYPFAGTELREIVEREGLLAPGGDPVARPTTGRRMRDCI